MTPTTDAPCDLHDAQIANLEAETERLAREIEKARQEEKPVAVQLAVLAARIPENLPATLAELKQSVDGARDEVREVQTTLKQDYVTKTEFAPVKRFVDWAIYIVLAAVAASVLALVLRGQ